MIDKAEKYRLLLQRLQALPQSSAKERLGLLAGMLQEDFGFLWSGFYFVENLPGIDSLRCAGKVETHGGKGPWLVLGPNAGPPACEMISFGRGVCGTAWAEGRTIVVEDVDKFPGHIACSSESRSEIVLPLFRDGRVIGVLDIDSNELAAFDGTDAEWLRKIADAI